MPKHLIWCSEVLLHICLVLQFDAKLQRHKNIMVLKAYNSSLRQRGLEIVMRTYVALEM